MSADSVNRTPFPSSNRTGLLGALLPLVAMVLSGCSLFRPSVPDEIPVYFTEAVEGEFRAGAAAVDISPREPVWIAGYGPARTSRGIHDPLYARALVLARGELQVAIVAVDLIGIQREEILRIQEKIDSFDPRHVLIVSTHNHNGPDTLGLWGYPPFISGLEEEYLEEVVTEGILSALAQARDNLQPAELLAGSALVEPEGILKNLRRPGLVDAELGVILVRNSASRETISTVIALGSHPECLGRDNTQITADFPAWTIAKVEKSARGVGIFVPGALGGLVTPDSEHASPEGEWAEAKRVGHRVADATLEVLRSLSSSGDSVPPPKIRVWHSPMFLPNENFAYNVVRWMGMLDRTMYDGGHILTEVNLWEIGGLRIVTIPGEITPDLGLRIKAACGGDPTILVGLANDELGYLVPEEDYALSIYDYERTLCVAPDAGERLARRLGVLSVLANQRRYLDRIQSPPLCGMGERLSAPGNFAGGLRVKKLP